MAATAITRREALRAAGAAGLAGAAGCLGKQGTATEKNVSGTIKIGVLQPTSGPVKYYGRQGIKGFYAGLAHKAGKDPLGKKKSGAGKYTYDVGDVTYELYVRDTKFVSSKALQKAKNLVTNQNVDMLFGCTNSGSARKVIKNVVNRDNVDAPIMVGPAASAGITSNKATCSDQVFRASENTAMDALSGGKYVANQTDVNKVYLFGADYSFGHAVVRNYEKVLKSQGVEIVGKKFVPPGHDKWKGLLQNAEDAGAEGIVGGFTVKTLPALFTTFLQGDYSYRLFGGWATKIAVAATGAILQKTLGKPLTKQKIRQAKLGPFTTRYHWNQYDNSINDSFVKTYSKAYGIAPDLFTSGTFAAASAIDQAIRAAASTKGPKVAGALKGMTVAETPKGKDAYTFQSYNNQARSAMTVADPVPTKDKWSDVWPAAVQPGKPLTTIGADKTTIPKDGSQMDCSL